MAHHFNSGNLGNMCFRGLSLVTEGHCTKQHWSLQKAERVERFQQSFSPELGLTTNDFVHFLSIVCHVSWCIWYLLDWQSCNFVLLLVDW